MERKGEESTPDAKSYVKENEASLMGKSFFLYHHFPS